MTNKTPADLQDTHDKWPPVKKAIWSVLMSAQLNGDRYIKAKELCQELYEAARHAAPAERKAAGEGVEDENPCEKCQGKGWHHYEGPHGETGDRVYCQCASKRGLIGKMAEAVFIEEMRLMVDPSVPQEMVLFPDEATKQWFLKQLAEIAEHEASFELRWDADMRAIKMWHEAGGDPLTWPDHADLVVWLLEKLKARTQGAAVDVEAQFLWKLLDDIDTASDIAKGNHELYRSIVEATHRRRFEIGSTDGYTVTFKSSHPAPSSEKGEKDAHEFDMEEALNKAEWGKE